MDIDQLDHALDGFRRVQVIFQGAVEAGDDHRTLVFAAAFAAYRETIGKLTRTIERLNWRRERW
jgi:hypothetical protein